MKDQTIASEDDLEDNLTDIWETVSRDLFEFVFYEWMSRLEWVTKHERECYINPH
jgi:hypothetical protein